MYAYIKGELADIEEGRIVVETQGVGYQIQMPAQMIDRLPGIGNTVKIYTHLQVREDAFVLFGFLTKDDRKVFRLLIGVNGIGPKGAQGILSVLTTDELRFAVLSDDVATISKAPGIGKKTAQKLILELRDKLSLEDTFEQKTENQKVADSRKDPQTARNQKDAVDALVALGYSATEALKAVKRVEGKEELTVEQLLKESLKHMYD